MTRPERILLVAVLAMVFIGALVSLTVVYRDELRQVIVVPLQEGWQDFVRAWQGMGADFRWGVFIIILFTVLFISFPSPAGSWERPMPSVAENGAGRLIFWSIELKTLLEDGAISRLSIFELRRLALDVVGFRQQMSTVEAGAWLLERLEAGDADIPPPMRLLVDLGALMPPAKPALGSLNLIHLFRLLFGLSKEGPASAPALTVGQLEAIIHYLEQVLEVSNEHNNR